MPRIGNAGNTATLDDDRYDEPDMDTADRVRESRMRRSNHETRDAEMDARNLPRSEAADYVWEPPSNLKAPHPRPGYVQRWIRSDFRSEADNLNWQHKMREGWVPRDPATVPEVEVFFGSRSHMDKSVISVGGLILCEKPIQQHRAKQMAVREATRRQEQSVQMETDKTSREGMRQGYAPIVRQDEVAVSTGKRRPPTLSE